MNAHVIRLDALGRRLTEMANLDKGEFDFDSEPAVGGPEGLVEGAVAASPDLSAMLDDLTHQIKDRERQLSVLESLISTRNLSRQIVPGGRPVTQGWISSYFGHRADPFTGRNAFHRGLDFAGPAGAQVVAVASGVVTYSKERFGYGKTRRDQPRQRLRDPLCAQPARARRRRRHRAEGPADRADRLDRPLDRPAPALRSAEAGSGRRPDELRPAIASCSDRLDWSIQDRPDPSRLPFRR